LGVALLALSVACALTEAPRTPEAGAGTDAIRARGILRAGVRQDLPRFAYLEPMTNHWDGFEVALARELAAAILGDPAKLELVRVTETQRAPYLRDGAVDVVIAQLTRETSADIEVSTPYLVAGVGLLVPRSRASASIDELARATVCAVKRSPALEALNVAMPAATPLAVDASPDCLTALASGAAAAMAGELPLLVRFALEDPSTVILPSLLREQALVVGVSAGNADLLRAVNATLANLRASGRWSALHRRYFDGLLAAVQPPA
jgi:polar amino acid transport system substrate-binding protein